MSKEVVIFCQSYTQIKGALYLITHNYDTRLITLVIPGNHDLYKFFKLVDVKWFHDKVHIIYFERYKRRISQKEKVKSILYVLPDIIRERRYLKAIYSKYFTKLRGAEVFFFSRYWSDYAFYILKKIGKRNRLVYVPDPAADALIIGKVAPTNITDLAISVVLKLIFGWDITIGKYIGQVVNGIPDKLIEKDVDKVIGREERDEMLRDIDLSKFQVFNVEDYDVIYFGHDMKQTRLSRNTMKKELSEIFAILSKYFPENRIALKYHPQRINDKTIINVGVVLEDFIPAELLYNEKVKIYLSPYSLSIANVEKGLAISLIDLISFKNDRIKQQEKDALMKRSRMEILFPKSLDEFEQIVADSKRQI